jgi:hypothetical protein
MVGDDGYITALDEDEKEICALFRQVLLDFNDKSTIRSLRKEQAKCFMQVLQEVRFRLRLAINTARRWNCRHLKEVLRCCKKTGYSIPVNEYLLTFQRPAVTCQTRDGKVRFGPVLQGIFENREPDQWTGSRILANLGPDRWFGSKWSGSGSQGV